MKRPRNELICVNACLNDNDFRNALKKAHDTKKTTDIEYQLDVVYKIDFGSPDKRKQALKLIVDIDWSQLNNLERVVGRIDMG